MTISMQPERCYTHITICVPASRITDSGDNVTAIQFAKCSCHWDPRV